MRRHRLLVAVACVMAALGQAGAREYYVSVAGPQADDGNPGTEAAPFKTLGKACEVVGPSDVVHIGAGTYRETLRPHRSGEVGEPIRFVATPGGRVVLSGAERLNGTWELHQGSIYSLRTDLRFVQLFVDGRMMPEARWPNTPPGDLMTYNRATAGEGTGYEVLADPNLPPGDWNGGVVLIWPGSRWVSGTRRITEYEPGKSLRFDRTFEAEKKDQYHASDPYKPRAGNPYLLMGSLDGLDSPGEWYLDEGTGTLYLWAPDGASPAAHEVEVKQRDYACDLRGLSFIEVSGMDIFGAAVNMTDSQRCALEDCRLRYVEHYRETDLYRAPPALNVITGQGNEWRRCLVAYAATSGLTIGGEDNRLVNSVVHDVNYLGTGRGGVSLSRSVGAVVSHCSLFRAGRDTLQHGGSKRIRIEYSDLYYTNMLNADSGAIYCWGTDGEGGVIAYNWVHDNLGDSTVGIYLDNFSRNFIVHHNVVWNCTGSGIRLNSDALNHQVYNNTIQQVREPFGTYCYANYTPTMQGTRIINNLVNAAMHPTDPSEFVQGELGPELHHNGPGAVDRDAYPVAGSAAIDAGIVIEGITDGFRGQAPDLGAYEFGGERWVAGADWQDPEAPSPPARDLHYTPRGPVTEGTMIAEGLVLWLDAADRGTLDVGPDGRVTAWRDRSPGQHVARPGNTTGSVKLVPDGLNGKPVVRGDGTGNLRIDGARHEPGPVTVFVVSQALEAAGPSWQRIIASFTGEGKEWELPNWMIGHPGRDRPATYPAQVFTIQQRKGAAVGLITVLGASAVEGQYLAGDVAEVLVFDRTLRFDEFEAVERYLKGKWGLGE
jgi:hypothetical protein